MIKLEMEVSFNMAYLFHGKTKSNNWSPQTFQVEMTGSQETWATLPLCENLIIQ